MHYQINGWLGCLGLILVGFLLLNVATALIAWTWPLWVALAAYWGIKMLLGSGRKEKEPEVVFNDYEENGSRSHSAQGTNHTDSERRKSSSDYTSHGSPVGESDEITREAEDVEFREL